MKTLNINIKFAMISLLSILMISGSFSLAQPGPGPDEAKREKIKSQKIAFITDKLDLNSETAQVFWPVYNEAEAKKEKIMKAYREKYKKEVDLDALSDKELFEMADAHIIHRQQIDDIDKTYHSKYKTILSAKQLVLLYGSEKEFRLVLLKQLRQKNRQGQPVRGGDNRK